jgi:hypothetical protein
MIGSIFSIFFKRIVYIKFNMDWMSVREVETGKLFEEKPILAIIKNKKGKNVIVGVGTNG